MRRFKPWQPSMYKYTGLFKHPGLCADMRLGKSIVIIRRIKSYRYKNIKVLIVAPFSSFYDWSKELKKENINDFCFLTGIRKKRIKLLKENHEWYILNTDGWRSIPEITEVNWNCIVFDESTFISNPKTQITKFFCKYFRNVDHRFILSGTPIEEGLIKIFCQMLFLDSGNIFGKNFYEFRIKNFKPDFFGNNWKIKKSKEKEIIEKLGNRLMILQKSDIKEIKCLKEYKTLSIELPKKLLSVYKQAEEIFILEYGKTFLKTKAAIAKYNWLRQLSGGLIDNKIIWDDKIDLLLNNIESIIFNEQFIILCDFIEEIRMINNRLLKKGYISRKFYGGLSKEQKFDTLDKFNNKKLDCIVCQNKSITYGTNLSNANTIFRYSRPLSGLVNKQAEERIIIPNKKNISFVYDIITLNTVDFDIYVNLIEKKDKAQQDMNLIKNISNRKFKL